MFNLTQGFAELALAAGSAEIHRPRKSHGLVLVKIVAGRRGPIMTHAPRGKVWPGPGITGSVRRAMQRGA